MYLEAVLDVMRMVSEVSRMSVSANVCDDTEVGQDRRWKTDRSRKEEDDATFHRRKRRKRRCTTFDHNNNNSDHATRCTELGPSCVRSTFVARSSGLVVRGFGRERGFLCSAITSPWLYDDLTRLWCQRVLYLSTRLGLRSGRTKAIIEVSASLLALSGPNNNVYVCGRATASRTELLRKARLGHRRYIVLRSLFMRSKQQSLAPNCDAAVR
ncbi:hypothetical protein KC356_g263 [Hortaea werneckii]|nr:hypothetical protein KC356_g263 [Hortaea werneckii]